MAMSHNKLQRPALRGSAIRARIIVIVAQLQVIPRFVVAGIGEIPCVAVWRAAYASRHGAALRRWGVDFVSKGIH